MRQVFEERKDEMLEKTQHMTTVLLNKVVIPLLQIALTISVVCTISIFLYFIAYNRWVPRAIVDENVYFDFTVSPAMANLNLNKGQKQWDYVKAETIADKARSSMSFFKPDSSYNINALLSMAKSKKNYESGKFALTLTTIDSSGDVVAKSVRPVALPYQSPTSLLIETVALQPLRLLHLARPQESVDLFVPLMDAYREPQSSAAQPQFTERLELLLSSAAGEAPGVDLLAARITIMPQVAGVT